MSGTRALFASIGASVSLVAAAALSLLAVSAVFAFGGWSDPVAQSAPQTALILAAGQSDATRTTRRDPIVLPARAPAQGTRQAARATARPQTGPAVGAQAVITRSGESRPPKASFTPAPAGDPPATVTPPAASAPPKKSAGDGVRTAGEDLSGKVQGTADALAQVTDPLLPPVAAATQKVLNVVAELLRRTTDGLGSTVDGLLAPR
ncbi:MAG: hypothetical protein Q8K79_10615 [Solirubrobacteraceae bacterium]|nr:hypothetical protein [Solirubrobacteraceae bacterium]